MSEERAFLREAQRELHRQQELAVVAWLEGRREIGATSFVGKLALRHVRINVEAALVRDEWRDVERAVREVARGLGSPWRIPSAAADIGSRRRELEHAERKMAAR